jgi:hypothetical protein
MKLASGRNKSCVEISNLAGIAAAMTEKSVGVMMMRLRMAIMQQRLSVSVFATTSQQLSLCRTVTIIPTEVVFFLVLLAAPAAEIFIIACRLSGKGRGSGNHHLQSCTTTISLPATIMAFSSVSSFSRHISTVTAASGGCVLRMVVAGGH